MLTTFLPLVAAWLLVAPHLGAFDADRVADIGQIWRPFWAMVLAAPMAGFLRGLWLGRPVPPVFILVIGGISALAMVVWRAVHGILFVRSRT